MAKCITEKNVYVQNKLNKFVVRRMENYKLEDVMCDNGLTYLIRLIDNYFPLNSKDKKLQKKFVLQYFGNYKKVN